MTSSIHSISLEQRIMLAGLANIYSSVFLVDLKTKEYEVIKTIPQLHQLYDDIGWPRNLKEVFHITVEDTYLRTLVDYADFDVVAEQLSIVNETLMVTFKNKIGDKKWSKAGWLVAQRDDRGRATHAFLVISDVDEEKRKQQEQLKDITDTVELAEMGIWRIALFDGEQPKMKASDKMLELLGLGREANLTDEEIYTAWYSRIYEDALPSVQESVNKMLAGQRDENTYRWNHPVLGERYVRCGGVSFRVPGRGSVIQGYHYDVTDAVKAEQEKQLVINSLAQTYSALFYIDLEHKTYSSYCNNNAIIEASIPRKGILSEGFAVYVNQLVVSESKEVVKDFVDMTTINERMKNKKSISIKFLGISDTWYEATFVVYDCKPDGTIDHLMLCIRDVNAQKRAELQHMEDLQKSVEANNNKTILLQNMTHEIRTPLNAMFGFSQLLSLPDGSFSDEEKSDFFKYIYNSFNMLSMLIDDVLDVADADHGNYRIIIQDVNVNEVCRSSIQMAEARKPEGVNMYFTTDLDDSYTISSDGRRIQQVLINYLTNACKHTTEGEIHLHCSTTENPGRLTFSVTDTGEGVPPEMAHDIFERFKKLNAMVQGSGLGLNICNVVAEKLHGEVKLDTSYTDGARFVFIL